MKHIFFWFYSLLGEGEFQCIIKKNLLALTNRFLFLCDLIFYSSNIACHKNILITPFILIKNNMPVSRKEIVMNKKKYFFASMLVTV
jgi:hypothetical protein